MLRNRVQAHWAVFIVAFLTIGMLVGWDAISTRAKDAPEAVRNRTGGSVSETLATADSSTQQNKDGNPSLAKQSEAKFSVTIRKPAGPPRVDLGIVDASGKPVTAACTTCHTTRPADETNRTPADLKEFHKSMTFAHGKVSCLSCHNPENYDTLRLADGRTVEYSEVMTLCAQCHGPQTRDYEHGAHGGMTGHWDLARGPRVRNNCVDCHDPHTPGFPAMKPTFKPRDRFLSSDDTKKASSHE